MNNFLVEKIVSWQRRTPSSPRQLLVVIPIAFLIFIFSPGIFLGHKLDTALSLPAIAPPPTNLVIGGLLFTAGVVLFLWTTLLFVRVGEGTQTPVFPTRRLVTTGPYAYSRNPMVSGVILMVSGLGILVNSIGFIAAGLIIPVSYLIFIKLIEEKELEARFGQEYVEYKKRTPFLIPTFRRPPSPAQLPEES